MTGARRWIVEEKDGLTVGQALARLAPEDPHAIAEGRAFLGKVRVASPTGNVPRGSELLVYRAPPPTLSPVEILGQEDGIVAAYKPPEIPTVADHYGRAHSLHGHVARWLQMDPAHVHATSRLDVGVSGVVLFALEKSARQRLEQARAAGTYRRCYVAIVHGAAAPTTARWTTALGRGPDPRRRYANGQNARPAATQAFLVAQASTTALLRVEPETGRTHQIRVHAAHAGFSILGDSVYGKTKRLVSPTGVVLPWSRLALHAWAVTVPGRQGAPRRFVASIPSEMSALWSALQGAPEAWQSFDPSREIE